MSFIEVSNGLPAPPRDFRGCCGPLKSRIAVNTT